MGGNGQLPCRSGPELAAREGEGTLDCRPGAHVPRALTFKRRQDPFRAGGSPEDQLTPVFLAAGAW
jgi:hypothetical protein